MSLDWLNRHLPLKISNRTPLGPRRLQKLLTPEVDTPTALLAAEIESNVAITRPFFKQSCSIFRRSFFFLGNLVDPLYIARSTQALTCSSQRNNSYLASHAMGNTSRYTYNWKMCSGSRMSVYRVSLWLFVIAHASINWKECSLCDIPENAPNKTLFAEVEASFTVGTQRRLWRLCQ